MQPYLSTLEPWTFSRKVSALMLNSKNPAHGLFEPERARLLLEAEPLRMELLHIYAWLLGALLQHAQYHVAIDEYSNIRDAHLLANYLRAIAKLSKDDLLNLPVTPGDDVCFFDAGVSAGSEHSYNDPERQGLAFIQTYLTSELRAQSRSRPYGVYGSIYYFMGGLTTHENIAMSHPVLLAMVEHHILEPNDVIGYFERAMGDLESISLHFSGHGKPRLNASQLFLYALRPLMLDTQWRPAQFDWIVPMWKGHILSAFEKIPVEWETREAAFLRCLLNMDYKQLHCVLDYLDGACTISRKSIEACFPLPFFEGDPQVVSLFLAHICAPSTEAEATERTRLFMMLLSVYHPRIHQLMCTYLHLYTTKIEARGNWQTMVDAFKKIATNAHEEPLCSIDMAELFEET